MSRLTFALPLAFSFAAAGAAPAFAQPAADGPPGYCDCPAPAMVAAAAPELPHWAIALHLGSATISPTDTPDQKSEWGGGGLELRYRLAPRWELGLAVDGGREQLADGSQGDRTLERTTLSARFHPRPYATWDFYGIAGVGSAAIGTVDQPPPPDAHRGLGTLGLGVERRFGHIGIAAELSMLGIGAPKAQETPVAMPVAASAPGATTAPPAMTTADNGYGGGSFTLAASYAF